jgi:hypothetical protein
MMIMLKLNYLPLDFSLHSLTEWLVKLQQSTQGNTFVIFNSVLVFHSFYNLMVGYIIANKANAD